MFNRLHHHGTPQLSPPVLKVAGGAEGGPLILQGGSWQLVAAKELARVGSHLGRGKVGPATHLQAAIPIWTVRCMEGAQAGQQSAKRQGANRMCEWVRMSACKRVCVACLPAAALLP
jgi:hypothetical protein